MIGSITQKLLIDETSSLLLANKLAVLVVKATIVDSFSQIVSQEKKVGLLKATNSKTVSLEAKHRMT